MKQYSFLEEGRLTYSEISRDPFMEKFFEVTGFIHEDCWTEIDWEKLVTSLKSEALMCAPTDTAAREKLDEAIIKCYYSGIPYLTSLAKEAGQYVIDTHDQSRKSHNGMYHFVDAMSMGYMSLLAAAIETYILKRHTWHDVYDCDMTQDPINTEKTIADHKIGERVMVTWRSVQHLKPMGDMINRYGVITQIDSETGLYSPYTHALYTVRLDSGNIVQVTDDQIEDKKV